MRCGDDQRITIRQVVSDFLTAVVGVVTLDADFGELADVFRKSQIPAQRSQCAFLNDLCFFCVHDISLVDVEVNSIDRQVFPPALADNVLEQANEPRFLLGLQMAEEFVIVLIGKLSQAWH
jgi:hypothetical protein